MYCRNRTSYENFKLKLCTRAQSPALGTRTKFQLEILTINVISGMVYFREIFLESLETLVKHRFLTTCMLPSPLGQNSRHLADDIFKCIFMNESVCILNRISLKFVPRDPFDNKSAMVQVMAWRRTGDKPLPEPMLTQFTEHICGTMGRWANPSDSGSIPNGTGT